MKSEFIHALCAMCWIQRHPKIDPNKVLHAPKEVCCGCGDLTTDGIYERGQPTEFQCAGEHEEFTKP